ncbi:ADP-ribosylglycohydrolase [Dethiosulfatibacter aminovorans DSM 17477]|uniref:ADP-ribosylglycohydrolase n=1 Tax=Dethiosulfatibacter aminovorans DSM 17477 TaxID=1121476 RepID=A0A1M6MDI3_9FIRM|nr:ADP-ribosylglycohydrolase family protein [Dethiosulfatibacter aminovorans]SHJ81515.1 ADP-ribosylglycohydrolase [Dethiosulfatibacter aminovorans DSM 17477]
MLGAIIGDIVGSRFERNNIKSKEFELFTEECSVTDDSIMTLAVAKTIMEVEEKELKQVDGSSDEYFSYIEKCAVKNMQELGRKYPYCGFSSTFYKWIISDDPQPYNSYGNGAAMKVSPVGFYVSDENEIKRLTKSIIGVSHNHEEGIKGAEATVTAIFMARKGCSKEGIRKRINEEYYTLDFKIDDIRDDYAFDATCQGSVPQAITAFLESGSFEDAIRTAVSLGGDSDTIAAIAGSIAEAYYGIPEELKAKAISYLDDYLLGIYDEWCRMIPY